ncbi:MAG TPA: hypothetical protein DCS97_04930 [Planctomycetes bacterium]|nr:hypothetical protein [Planctomycetota bacterium]
MERAFRFLIVDDERINRVVLEGAVRQLSRVMQPHRAPPDIEMAEDGLAALNALRAGSFDGVFMDLMMPVMDGATAIKTMHAEGMRLPIIVVTAMDPAAVRRLPLHTVLSIVFKPISSARLEPPLSLLFDTITAKSSTSPIRLGG